MIDFNEIAYVIEGEMDLISENEMFNVKEGDYYFWEIGKKFKIVIKKYLKLFMILYPIDETTMEVFKKKMIDKNT